MPYKHRPSICIGKTAELETALDLVDYIEANGIMAGFKFQVEIINRTEFYVYSRRGFPLHPVDQKRAKELMKRFVYERKHNVRSVDASHHAQALHEAVPDQRPLATN